MQIPVTQDESLTAFLARVGCVEATLREDNQTLIGDVANLTTSGFDQLEVRVKEVEPGPKESLTDFEGRIPGCTHEQLLVLNPALRAGLGGRFGEAVAKLPVRTCPTLAVQDHIVVGRLVAPEPPRAPEPLLGKVDNPAQLWLTYECLFNQRPFRKTNQACEMGLYRIPLDRVRVFLRDNIDPKLAAALADAFFPELESDWVKGVSTGEWKWKEDRPTVFKPSPSAIVASRSRNVVYTKSYVVLPYNYTDNTRESKAIGTRKETDFGATLTKLSGSWQFWKTASRSCIVELKRAKEKRAAWHPLLVKEYGWDYPMDAAAPEAYLGRRERGIVLEAAAKGDTAFNHAEAAQAFSVKTGVVWIGNVSQTGASGHKDKLEENCIVACLRSDLVAAQDRAAKRDPKTATGLLVQTELLSLTDKSPGDPRAFGDGVQVRDLSVLDPDMIYIPPISIPFLDLEMTKIQRRFDHIEDEGWRDFWCESYAEALGRAKAIMLLRYGLHMGSPNAQNWLLEFRPGASPIFTGRVVARDVGDAYLHREVIWAQHGGPDLPPQGPEHAKQLAKVNSKIIKFECEDLASKWSYYPQETGSMYEQEYGPPGTRFLWHRFSSLSRGRSVETTSLLGPDPDAYSRGWRRVLMTMSEWGLAHNKAYAGYLEDKLNTNFEIEWDAAPDPARYLDLDADDRKGAARCFVEDSDWEDGKEHGASVIIHRFLASEAGQAAIRALKPSEI